MPWRSRRTLSHFAGPARERMLCAFLHFNRGRPKLFQFRAAGCEIEECPHPGWLQVKQIAIRVVIRNLRGLDRHPVTLCDGGNYRKIRSSTAAKFRAESHV